MEQVRREGGLDKDNAIVKYNVPADQTVSTDFVSHNSINIYNHM